jgi:hypothetical protein
MGGDQHDADGDQQQHGVRPPHLQVDRLEAAEADRAHHQLGRDDDHRQREHRLLAVEEAGRIG